MAEDDKLSPLDATLLRRAFALAGEARARGDRPFAAVIADEKGQVLVEAGRITAFDAAGVLAEARPMLAAIRERNRDLYAFARRMGELFP